MATCNKAMFLMTFISVCIVCQKMQIMALSIEDSQSRENSSLSRSVSSSSETKATKESNSRHVVCYFTSWSGGRSGKGKFTPEDIDPNLCTHINYAFASLSNETLNIVPRSPLLDIDQRFYERIINLKKKNERLKVLLSIGGWMDSKGAKYSRMVSESSSRKNFTKEAVRFLKNYQFDGLDLDWEYPACWQGDCSTGNPKDKEYFVLLVKELRTDFEKSSPPLLLTVALTSSRKYAKKSYAVGDLAQYVDFFNVMCYNIHGSWGKSTGHASEFRSHSVNSTEDHSARFVYSKFLLKFSYRWTWIGSGQRLQLSIIDRSFWSTAWFTFVAHIAEPKYTKPTVSTMEYFVGEGAPREKLIMGMPLYGRSFTLQDPNNHSIGAPVIGPGTPGVYTKQAGVLAYYEICDLITNHNWTVQRDTEAGTYAFYGNQWVGYDDRLTAKQKSLFVLEKGYGGMMVWEISMDDFGGECHNNKFPIIRTLKMFMQPNVSVEGGSGSSSTFDTSINLLIWTAAFVLFQERRNFFFDFNYLNL